MSSAAYRLLVDGDAAAHSLLERIERITVEQQIDMIWQARIELQMATDDQGVWGGEEEQAMQAFTRLRVEVRIGDGRYRPLIDGPVVGVARRMNAEPGRSVAVLRVHDDSTYLNRDESVEVMEDLRDHEVAERLFGTVSQIAETEIETTTAPASSLPPVVVQRGTPMQLLRRLARRQGMHAYVLPGTRPGRSIGCFRPLPTAPDGLPDLVLLGVARNLTRFDVDDDALRPVRVVTRAMDAADGRVHDARSGESDLDLLGDEGTVGAETATVLAPPGLDGAVDPESAVRGQSSLASYGIRATGELVSGCYGDLLSPYRIVAVAGINRAMSGDYVIEQVTHTLDRSAYLQSFRLRRNARTSGSMGGRRPGGIF